LLKILTLDDIEVKGKIVLTRVDFNSPVDPETKKILDDSRIRAHGETTINELAKKGAKVVILAHQGRPGESDFISLNQHAQRLEEIICKPVEYIDDLYGVVAQNSIKNLRNGEILLLINTRVFLEEMKYKEPAEHAKSDFVKNLAALADLFINDAFSTAHRSHASVVGFSHVLPTIAGRIMERELESLRRVVEEPEKPCIFILGGAKVDDSLDISRHVLKNNIADYILTGGVVGHLFLVARGVDLGKYNVEYLKKQNALGLISGIKELIEKYREKIKTPVDIAINIKGKRKQLLVDDLPTEYPIFDIGKKTISQYNQIISGAKSIVISGPLGVYEQDNFFEGTKGVLEAVALSKGFSLAGGGHTIAAIYKLGINNKISYISTAGGALIEYMMGRKLPGVSMISKRQ
jgi:phosphoglycerate kinase